MSELLRMAARGVTRNRRRSAITGTMLVLGVAAVVFASSLIAGLQVFIGRVLVDVRFGHAEIARHGYLDSVDLSPLDLDVPARELAALVQRVPGVAAASPRIRFVGMISRGETTQLFGGLGAEPGAEGRVCPRGPASRYTEQGLDGARFFLIAGQGLGPDDGIVLGVDLAESLHAGIGDTVTMLAQTRGGSVDGIDAVVVGIYRWDSPDDNRRSVVVPLALAQRLLHMDNRVTSIAVRATEGADADHLVRTLGPLLAAYDAEARTWRDLSPYFRDVMRLQDRVVVVLMLIIFLLLMAGIATTMWLSVHERTREIGTLICIGMRRRHVMALFVCESLILGVLASIAGLALGIGLVSWAHHAGLPFTIPAVGKILTRPCIDTAFTVLAAVAAVASALGASIVPAYRASRLDPVEALRAV